MPTRPLKMMAAGIGAISEDRHQEGIVGTMSVAENLILTRLTDPTFQFLDFEAKAYLAQCQKSGKIL